MVLRLHESLLPRLEAAGYPYVVLGRDGGRVRIVIRMPSNG
jgi:hypothetical protein